MFATRTPTAELTAGIDYAVVPALFKARFVARDAAAGTVTLEVPEPVGAVEASNWSDRDVACTRPRTATVTIPTWLATSLFAFYDTRDVPALKDFGAPTIAHAGDEGQDGTAAGFVVLPEVDIWAGRPRPVITPVEAPRRSQTVLKLRSPQLPSTVSVADASAFQQADPAALLLLTLSSSPVRHEVVPMIVFEHVVAPFASHLHCDTLEEGLGAVTALTAVDDTPGFQARLRHSLRKTKNLTSVVVRSRHVAVNTSLCTYRDAAATLTSLDCSGCPDGLYVPDFGDVGAYPVLRRLAVNRLRLDDATKMSEAFPNLEDIKFISLDWREVVSCSAERTLFPRLVALRLVVAWRVTETTAAALEIAEARSLSLLALDYTADSFTHEGNVAEEKHRVPDCVAEMILDGVDIFNARGSGVGIPLLFTSSSLKKLVLPETDVGSCTGSTAWATTTSPITHLVVKDVTKSRCVCSRPSELGDSSWSAPFASPVTAARPEQGRRKQGGRKRAGVAKDTPTKNPFAAAEPFGLTPQPGANPFAAAAGFVTPSGAPVGGQNHLGVGTSTLSAATSSTPSTNPFAAAMVLVKPNDAAPPGTNGAPSLPTSVAPPSASASRANPFSAFVSSSTTAVPSGETPAVATTPPANPFAAAAALSQSGLARTLPVDEENPVAERAKHKKPCIDRSTAAPFMQLGSPSLPVFVSGLEATLRIVDFQNTGQRWHRGSGEEAPERAVPPGSIRLRDGREQ